MGRSKLEVHIDILRSLSHNGSRKTSRGVNSKACADYGARQSDLHLLAKHKLIRRTVSRRAGRRPKVSYAITGKGRAVVKYFEEVDGAPATTADARKK